MEHSASSPGPRQTTWRRIAWTVLTHLPDVAQDYAYAIAHQLGRARDALSPTAGTRGTVVILPGIWEPARFMAPMAATLRQEGYRVEVVTSLRENLREPSLVAARVLTLLESDDLHDVVLVAHSKGGLVAKHLLLDPTASPRLAGAVCVCTPFSGSRWGPFFVPGLGIRELAPDATIITSLAAHTQANARITSIYPTFDPHVPDGSYLAGATNVELDGFGHLKVLSQPEFVQAAVNAVNVHMNGSGSTTPGEPPA